MSEGRDNAVPVDVDTFQNQRLLSTSSLAHSRKSRYKGRNVSEPRGHTTELASVNKQVQNENENENENEPTTKNDYRSRRSSSVPTNIDALVEASSVVTSVTTGTETSGLSPQIVTKTDSRSQLGYLPVDHLSISHPSTSSPSYKFSRETEPVNDLFDTPGNNGQDRQASNRSSLSVPRSISNQNNPEVPTKELEEKCITNKDRHRIVLLREEITRENEELRRLEYLAKELPKHRKEQAITANFDETAALHSLVVATDSVPVKVRIKSLYEVIDSLKLRIHEYSEVLTEERRVKDAHLRKIELMEKSIKVMTDQNQTLNRMLERKDQNITNLDTELRRRDMTIKQFELSELRRDSDQRVITLELQQCRNEKLLLEANYKALLQGTKDMKEKHASDMKDIIDSLNTLQKQREDDQAQIRTINERIRSQISEREQLLQLHAETTYMRQKHLDEINKIFTDMRNVVNNSEKSVDRKMVAILQSIQEFHEYEYHLRSGDYDDDSL